MQTERFGFAMGDSQLHCTKADHMQNLRDVIRLCQKLVCILHRTCQTPQAINVHALYVVTR